LTRSDVTKELSSIYHVEPNTKNQQLQPSRMALDQMMENIMGSCLQQLSVFFLDIKWV